jgi:hypothetical protein
MHWLVIATLLGAGIPKPRTNANPSVPAAKLTPTEIRDRAEAYLHTIDTPITADQWRALGPTAADVLEPVIQNAQEFPTRRAAAVGGLVYAAPTRAAALVGSLARDENQPIVVRVAAMHGAAQVLPSSKLVAELKPVLQGADNAGLRAAAADVLARHGKTAGCTAVKAQAAREQSKAGFEKPLDRCR